MQLQRFVNALPKAVQRRLPEYRAVVLSALGSGSVGAEVGVWRGDFSARLLRRVAPRHLYLIDPWMFVANDGYTDALYGADGAGSQAAMDEVHARVMERFAAQISSGQVSVMRLSSVEAAGLLTDDELDWVYIDGDHTHDQVLADLWTFLPKVRVGGLLCGDDYGDQGWWQDGVTTAFHEFVRKAPVRVEAVHNGQFILRRLA